MATPTGGRAPPRDVDALDGNDPPPPPSCRAAATAANHAVAAGPSSRPRGAPVLLRPPAFEVVAVRGVGVDTEYLVRFTEAGLGADEPPEWFPAAALRADPAGAAALAAFEAATGSTATLVPLTRAVGEAAPPPRQQQPPADSGGRLALTRAPAAPPRRPPALGFRGVIRADAADAYDWAGFRPLTRPAAATVVVLDAGASGGVSGGRSAGVPARLWMDARPRRADGLPPTQSPDDNESEPPPSSSAGDASDQDDAPPPPLTQLPLTQLPLEASPPPEAQPPDPPPRSRLRKPPSTRVARVVRPPGDAPRVRFAVSPAAESVEASESD